MQNVLDARMPSSQCISVFLGCPASPTQLPGGSYLIVDAADIDQKEWIDKEIFGGSFDELSVDDFVVISQTVLSEFDGQIINWYNFSDNRFNGPWELSEFSKQYPNLRLSDSKEYEGITLSSLLSNQKALSDPFSSFELNIRQGDPLVSLLSAKEWLARCARISLRCSVINPRRLRDTESFLKSSGFYQSSIDPSVWLPVLETSSLHLSLIRSGLLALFDKDAYQQLRPDLKDKTDFELMNHWLSKPDFREVAEKMKKSIRCMPTPFPELTEEDPLIQLLQSIFPFEFYRTQRPDLLQLSNREILNHFWQFGQHEGVDLSEKNIQNIVLNERLKDYDLENKTLTARVRELEKLLLCSNAQISAMQKLITGSQDLGMSNE